MKMDGEPSSWGSYSDKASLPTIKTLKTETGYKVGQTLTKHLGIYQKNDKVHA